MRVEKSNLCVGCSGSSGGFAGLHAQPLGSFLLSIAHCISLILALLILIPCPSGPCTARHTQYLYNFS